MHMFQHFWTCFDMFQLPRHHIFVLESSANIPSVQEKQAKKAVEVEKARRTDSFVACPPSCNGMRHVHMICLYIYICIYIYIYIYIYIIYIYMSWSKVGLHVTLKKEGWPSIHCTHYFLDSHPMGGPWPQWVDFPNGPTAAPRPLICKTEKHRRAPHPVIFYRWLVCFCPFSLILTMMKPLKNAHIPRVGQPALNLQAAGKGASCWSEAYGGRSCQC